MSVRSKLLIAYLVFFVGCLVVLIVTEREDSGPGMIGEIPLSGPASPEIEKESPVVQIMEAASPPDPVPAYPEVEWMVDPQARGGIRVVEETPEGTVEYAGTHMLARLAPGSTRFQVEQWLMEEQAGDIIRDRNSLLYIRPTQTTREAFLRLKNLLEADPWGLLEWCEPDYTLEAPGQPDAGADPDP